MIDNPSKPKIITIATVIFLFSGYKNLKNKSGTKIIRE